MYPRLARLAILLMVLLASLLPAACNIPDRAEPAEPVQEAAEPTAEPIAAPAAEDLAAVVNQNANVRTGPSTDHSVAYWLIAGDTVSIVGTSADGDWLQIEHEDRPGWIAIALVDFEDATRAEVEAAPEPEADPPAPMDEPTVEPVAEPTEAAVPTPAPTPQTELPGPLSVTVTGTTVNLRAGPGTEHPTNGQVRAGDALQATGRNAAGDWLLIVHPAATGELVWIYAPLTDISAAALQTLATVSAVGVEPPPAAAPQAISEPALAYDDIEDCTQWHTVNANETRLSQITDWFGLDLQLVETINRVSDTEQLVTGMQLCLKTSRIDTVLQATQPVATPAPAPASPITPPASCAACPALPDSRDLGHPNAPIGQKVVDSALDVLWHAPGSYSQDLPGLDYDFELVFGDASAMWDWSVRDFDACYDAVRVHMAEVAREVNLQQLEVQLHDPVHVEGVPGWKWGYRDYGNWYQLPWTNGSGMPYDAWPNWNPTHPDVGLVSLDCDYSPSTGQIVCDIIPAWGNSHSIHLNAAATLALANSIAVASDNAREYRHNRLDQRTIDFNAYLFPILDNNRGDPAGQGPCLDVARAR